MAIGSGFIQDTPIMVFCTIGSFKVQGVCVCVVCGWVSGQAGRRAGGQAGGWTGGRVGTHAHI